VGLAPDADAPEAFMDALVEHGLLVPGGAAGIYLIW